MRDDRRVAQVHDAEIESADGEQRLPEGQAEKITLKTTRDDDAKITFYFAEIPAADFGIDGNGEFGFNILVNDDDDVRFKRAKADDAMLALRRVPPKARREIVQAISERIAQGKPKEDYRLMRARKEMIELIDDVLAKEPDALRSLSVLRSAVEAIELPKEERDE